MALLAYQSVFLVQPTIELYRKVKKLSGLEWEKLRAEMLQRVSSANNDLRASIHLEEQEWDEGDGPPFSPDPPEFVAEIILGAIETGAGELCAHDWMKPDS